MRASEAQSDRYYRDTLARPLTSWWLRQVMDRSAAATARAMLAAGEFAPTDTLVEVGPGLGGFLVAVVESGVLERPPVAVELSGEMIELLRPRLERTGHGDVVVVSGSGLDLPELVGTASVVVAHGMVKHLGEEDLAVFFAAVRETLEPHGRFFVGDIASGTGPFARRVERAMGEHSTLRSAGELTDALTAAGFEAVAATSYGRAIIPVQLAWLRANRPMP